MSYAAEPLLECRRIGKRFGGVRALVDVDFALCAGEVHGVVGSNGAGKSTLMKVLAGALPDHEGDVLLAGRPAHLDSPQAALAQGIAMVYQELSGIGPLSVAENLFLGRQPLGRWGWIDWPAMRRLARDYLAELDIQIDVRRRLDAFPPAIRQMVEIARGIHSGARVLILDEPTCSLSPPETRRLFALVRRLRERDVAIVFISHFIEEVLEICDRVTVLRDGRCVATAPRAKLDKHEVIRRMLGDERARAEPGLEPPQAAGYEGEILLPPRTDVPPVLRAEKLALAGAFLPVDLEVSPGECLGVYGFVGAGHRELALALAGAARPTAGRVLLDGQPLRPGDTHHAVRRGVVLVGGDRAQGLFLKAEVYKNVTLAHLRRSVGEWLTDRREIAVSGPVLERVGCRPAEPRLPAGSLSGGNQQKAVVAKWLLGPVRVLVLDEPTRGMDIGAKRDVMRLIAQLKHQGAAVILSSAEPELVLAHADRIVVMSRGRITRQLAGAKVDQAVLLRDA
jgi:ribose transport system ATP-binding protein